MLVIDGVTADATLLDRAADSTSAEQGASPTPASRVTIDDRLPQSHRYSRTLAEAIRSRLGDVPGSALVVLRALGRILVQVDVVAPDGSRWSLGVPVHQGPDADAIAQIVKARCVPHSIEAETALNATYPANGTSARIAGGGR